MSSDMIYSPLWVQRRLISARLRRASILANSGPRSASSTRAREYKRMSARPGYCWFGAEASGGPSTRSINVGVQPRRIKAWRLNAVMSRREGRTRIHSTPADLPFNAAQIADHLAEVAGFTFQALIPDQLISNRQRFGQVGMRAAQDGQEMIVHYRVSPSGLRGSPHHFLGGGRSHTGIQHNRLPSAWSSQRGMPPVRPATIGDGPRDHHPPPKSLITRAPY